MSGQFPPSPPYQEPLTGFLVVPNGAEIVIVEVLGLAQRFERTVLRLGMRAMYCDDTDTWQAIHSPDVTDIPLVPGRTVYQSSSHAFVVRVCLATARRAGLVTPHLYVRTDPHNGLTHVTDRSSKLALPNFSALRAPAFADA